MWRSNNNHHHHTKYIPPISGSGEGRKAATHTYKGERDQRDPRSKIWRSNNKVKNTVREYLKLECGQLYRDGEDR